MTSTAPPSAPRAATDEAAETLAGRIEKAKALAIRLDTAIDRASAPSPNSPRADATTGAISPEGKVARKAGWGTPSAISPSPDGTPHLKPLSPRGRGVAPRSRALDDELFDDGDLRERLALRTAGARR